MPRASNIKLRTDDGGYLRPEVLAFAELMEKKLRENDHKGGWENCEPEWLLKRLREEVRELTDAVDEQLAYNMSGARSIEDAPPVFMSIGDEAADVANFALMVADIFGKLKL